LGFLDADQKRRGLKKEAEQKVELFRQTRQISRR